MNRENDCDCSYCDECKARRIDLKVLFFVILAFAGAFIISGFFK